MVCQSKATDAIVTKSTLFNMMFILSFSLTVDLHNCPAILVALVFMDHIEESYHKGIRSKSLNQCGKVSVKSPNFLQANQNCDRFSLHIKL